MSNILTTLAQSQQIANAVIAKVSAKGYAVAANLGALASKSEVAETDLAEALASKINGKADFRQNEIAAIKGRYHLTADDVDAIFFNL